MDVPMQSLRDRAAVKQACQETITRIGNEARRQIRKTLDRSALGVSVLISFGLTCKGRLKAPNRCVLLLVASGITDSQPAD